MDIGQFKWKKMLSEGEKVTENCKQRKVSLSLQQDKFK
jgi:hypothetical protein